MKFAALYTRDVGVGGIESSAGQQLVYFEAEDRDGALDFCAVNKLRYIMPLIPPFGIDRKKDNGHG